ncbi:MAG TPA: NAD(P)/FAD-dependent oxidoreductase [Longimicrobiales bacterium]|nr:NAD(P)/FAD-dependent oxidoreductase [Longimicrobiales bacterium]
MSTDTGVPHVVIVGGGFGGLYAARALRRAPVRITVIDRRNFHLFQPLLYQVATASLSPADIAAPIRSVLRRQRNTEVWMGEVEDIQPAARRLMLADGGVVTYDYLILATGATHAYFGRDDWADHAPGLKTIDDATEIRRRFLLAFEAAEREADPAAMKRLLTFVIVGAGPTGVELAGAMAEIARSTMPTDFRSIDTTSTRIILMEGLDRVLPGYPPDLSAKAQRQLERLGVEVRLGTRVTDIAEDMVQVGDESIAAGNVFWAAGVAASKLGAALGVETDRAGRVIVAEDLSVPGHPEVFVVGDLAAALRSDGSPVPGVAQGAMQGGAHAARQILRDLRGRARERFEYRDKGDLATIGRAAAVARIGRMKLSGFPAWVIWVVVHIMYLIGFRNRLLVLLQWAWAYLTYHRGIRLITGDVEMALARARGADEFPDAEPRRRRRRQALD